LTFGQWNRIFLRLAMITEGATENKSN
jgi:hypothetical protein